MNITASFKASLPFLILILSAACSAAGPRICTLSITGTSGRTVTLVAEIADTEPLRMRGLMHRRTLDEGRGMLFIFDDDSPRRFWMRDTRIPLSIAYVGRDGMINEIYHMKPLDVSVTYPSAMPARYALEVNRGWFERHGIGPGSRVDLHGCLRQ